MSQEQSVLFLLQQGPKTTSDFIRSDFGLAAEYRRAIANLRKKLQLKGQDIVATKVRPGLWEYRLVKLEPVQIEFRWGA